MSLPAGDYSPASITFVDHSNEKSVFSIYGTLLTAANFVAQRALWETLVNAIAAITLGTYTQTSYGVVSTFPETIPVSPLAQREMKLLVMFRDATNGQKFTATIPTITLSILDFQTNAGDFVSMTAPAAINDFVTAFEAFARTPAAQNATVITALKFVGRSS